VIACTISFLDANFSKAQAVRWVVHLVGDIHQPLHVTSGYYRTTPAALKHPTILKDPAAAAAPGVVSDRGGNGLVFDSPPSNLHSVWDGCLVQLVDGTPCGGGEKTYTGLSRKLAKWATLPEAEPFKPTGNHHEWPAQWATDALKVAVRAEVYSVKLAGAKVQATDGGNEVFQAKIAFTSRQTYAEARVRAAREQLVKAAVRLAELLNAIAWK
jgi:hypothetical protein